MGARGFFSGRGKVHVPPGDVRGGLTVLPGKGEFYRIANYDRLAPFFMTLVSSGDCWLFLSSNGGLTAGRENPDHALFPYLCEDKIHDAAETTGSHSVLFVNRGGNEFLWEPFKRHQARVYDLRRNLYKSVWGGEVIFEEENLSLGLSFRYGWQTSEKFGFIRATALSNEASARVRVRLLDGFRNLLPSGTHSRFQLEKSNLLDAYKRNELVPASKIGLFTLSSIPVDRPEPAESLQATVAWCAGMSRAARLLSSRQERAFREGRPAREETDERAVRGAYFITTEFALAPRTQKAWIMGADLDYGPARVRALDRALQKPAQFLRSVLADVEAGVAALRTLAAGADGLQASGSRLEAVRHYHSALFNIMRGGVFEHGHQVDTADLRHFILDRNRLVASRHSSFFASLPPRLAFGELLERARQSGTPQIERLCHEYLPLTFSRRHGDPSRPWNRFEIPPRGASGERALNYEGNWRDIFQNWEALAVSYPAFLPAMIAKFVNASTADGYNPYRISRAGIDWEIVDPEDPWSFIGYWGDHQIVYLLRLLEAFDARDPVGLRGLLRREIFSYADVPYRICSYSSLLKNPKDTVAFDAAADRAARERTASIGGDGKLVADDRGDVKLVGLAEKLLVPILTKLSNLVPEAGIWLNTQRPEWNDANNALVGNGASVVTLCYLRRHLVFCRRLFASAEAKPCALSSEVAAFLASIAGILREHHPKLRSGFSDRTRKQVLDALGQSGWQYRRRLYQRGFSGTRRIVTTQKLIEFFDAAIEWTTQSIRANRRPDGLYHSYNLLSFQSHSVSIRRLDEMLEGQVAALSSGVLSAGESVNLLRALRRSRVYQPDQRSYLLYPDRSLPGFMQKNNIPRALSRRSRLFARLASAGDTRLIERDLSGGFHFSGTIRNGADVSSRLDELARDGYAALALKERRLILNIFERVFDHQSFTGRSGTFFGYEGLGCIYWHMVSKLLLATQESFFRAVDSDAPLAARRALARAYHETRAGLGDRKSPAEYGAFPTDPYSHTPGDGGARQPGLTGQVKEDILCRFGELGVRVVNSEILFRPLLLQPAEFSAGPLWFDYVDVFGKERRISLPARALAFTFCQTAVVYRMDSRNRVRCRFANGSVVELDSLRLNNELSASVLARRGEIARIEVFLEDSALS
ncbi:MAG TPA: hypothetical protein VHH88_05600 [Verrucomicrobiae bacterium]|nr:hypothetical protein [Verrucomicrobiae bacterium]